METPLPVRWSHQSGGVDTAPVIRRVWKHSVGAGALKGVDVDTAPVIRRVWKQILSEHFFNYSLVDTTPVIRRVWKLAEEAAKELRFLSG